MNRAHRISTSLVASILALLLAVAGIRAQSTSIPGDGPGSARVGNHRFLIAPVEGLTTAWHPAPAEAGIPVGTNVTLRVLAPERVEIAWKGAEETGRDSRGSTAECLFTVPGKQVVAVTANLRNGRTRTRECTFEVVDVPLDRVRVHGLTARVAPLELDESSSNEELVERYMDPESISGLHLTGSDSYAVSSRRTLRLTVEVDPPALALLLEWRRDGKAMALGSAFGMKSGAAGLREISVGPPSREERRFLEVYSVRIEGPPDIVNEEPVTFLATTDPPGYEGFVTWLAATKLGSVSPVMGTGPTFTTVFSGTRGPGKSWLGVRGDQAVRGLDPEVTGVEIDEDDPPAVGGGLRLVKIRAFWNLRGGRRYDRVVVRRQGGAVLLDTSFPCTAFGAKLAIDMVPIGQRNVYEAEFFGDGCGTANRSVTGSNLGCQTVDQDNFPITIQAPAGITGCNPNFGNWSCTGAPCLACTTGNPNSTDISGGFTAPCSGVLTYRTPDGCFIASCRISIVP